MSNNVTNTLHERTLGISFPEKSVLLVMANWASDDGTGIWASKNTIALALETAPRTIQRIIKRLLDSGHLIEVGRKKHKNGETYEYRIDMKSVLNCPLVRARPLTHSHPSTQDVVEIEQHIADDPQSPLTHSHPTPDPQSPQPLTHSHPNLNKPNKTLNTREACEMHIGQKIETHTADLTDAEKIDAQMILDGKQYASNSIKISRAQKFVRLGIVTAGQCRAVGVSV